MYQIERTSNTPKHLVTPATKFSVVAPKTSSISIAIVFFYVQKCLSVDTLSRKHQIMVMFTGHSRTVGPQYRARFIQVILPANIHAIAKKIIATKMDRDEVVTWSCTQK
jgi:hypothetical protein